MMTQNSEIPLFAGDQPQERTPRIFQYLQFISDKYNIPLASYEDLWLWSISNIGEFWSTIYDFCEIIGMDFSLSSVTMVNLQNP